MKSAQVKRIRCFSTASLSVRHFGISYRLLTDILSKRPEFFAPVPGTAHGGEKLTELAKKLVDKIVSIEGVAKVEVYQYGISVTISPVYDWTGEVDDDVVDAIKSTLFPTSSDVKVEQIVFPFEKYQVGN